MSSLSHLLFPKGEEGHSREEWNKLTFPFLPSLSNMENSGKILKLLFAHILISIEEAKWSLIDRIQFQQQYESMNKPSHIQL